MVAAMSSSACNPGVERAEGRLGRRFVPICAPLLARPRPLGEKLTGSDGRQVAMNGGDGRLGDFSEIIRIPSLAPNLPVLAHPRPFSPVFARRNQTDSAL